MVVAGAFVAAYCDDSPHAEERLIARALDAGFQEKQATVDGATANYAEGPDNGPALVTYRTTTSIRKNIDR